MGVFLPDSGADISVADPAILESLNDRPDNLLMSSVITSYCKMVHV